MFRFIFGLFAGFFKLKFILWLVALWFVWSTMGTGWTIIIGYALAVYALWQWGPSDKKGMVSRLAMAPTKGSLYALVAPLVIVLFFPLGIINAVATGGEDAQHQ